MRLLQRFLRKENFWSRLGSLLLACTLWIYVMTEQNPIMERTIEINLRQTGLSDNMVVLNAPERVEVRVRGTRMNIADDLERHVHASVDLSNAVQGQQKLKISANAVGADVIGVVPSEASVYVDTITEKTVPVHIRVIGNLSKDMTVGHSEITPSEVILRGPTHRINKVSRVVAPVDVSNLEGSFSMECKLTAINDDGYDAQGMKIIPERAMVKANMVSQMLSVDLPIKLVVTGALPDGVVVSKSEILPEKVRVTAPPSVLKGVLYINTKQVDVSSLTGSEERAVELDIPDKVIPELRTVRLRMSVEKHKASGKIE